jgi:hypothetical protein
MAARIHQPPPARTTVLWIHSWDFVGGSLDQVEADERRACPHQQDVVQR